MRLLLMVLPLAGLAGCAGYAIDYTKSKTSLVAPELARFGLSGEQSRCLGDRLAASLSVWQLRQFQIAAGGVVQAYGGQRQLGGHELAWAARQIEDRRVAPEVERAADACGISRTNIAAAPLPEQAATPLPTAAAASAVAAWINLGAAATGQAISVDASSLAQEGQYRSGWFRLTDPGSAQRGDTGYRLRVDCSARRINSMAVRKYGPSGAVAEERDLGPAGEGEAPVEGGTVMEIAYLALCT